MHRLVALLVGWALLWKIVSLLAAGAGLSTASLLTLDIPVYTLTPLTIVAAHWTALSSRLHASGVGWRLSGVQARAEAIIVLCASPIIGVLALGIASSLLGDIAHLSSPSALQKEILDGLGAHGFRAAGVIYLSVSAGIVEEVVFRGAILVFVRQYSQSAAVFVLLSAAAFGLFHLPYGLYGVALATLFGLVMGVWFRYSRLLTPCVIAHICADLWAFSA